MERVKKLFLVIFIISLMSVLISCENNDSFQDVKSILEEKDYTFEEISLDKINWTFLKIEDSDVNIKTVYSVHSFEDDAHAYVFGCKNKTDASKLYNYTTQKVLGTNYRAYIKQDHVYVIFAGDNAELYKILTANKD